MINSMTDWTRLSAEEIIERFAGITVWKAHGQRAPHKPLLILWILARLQRGEQSIASFAEIDQPLKTLLQDFGPSRKSYHPEYPFWHLQSDGLWVIPEREALDKDLATRDRQKNPSRGLLLEAGAHGGFPPDLIARLKADPALVNQITQRILDDNFAQSIYQDLLDAVGMPWVVPALRRRRDPAFRDTILRIYQHRCAVCGFDAMLENSSLGIEAAHIRWHAAAGPDTEDNGLALCSLHHKALDRGAIGLDDQNRILVSQHVRGTSGVEEWLNRFSGRPLRGPQPGCPVPSPEHVRWHRREVFREPARGLG